MKFSFFLFCFLGVTNLFSQSILVGEDTTLCLGEEVQILGTPFDSSRITLLDNPTVINFPSDNSFSWFINIGFDFEFYGNTYNQVIVGTNGIVSFNAVEAHGFCDPTPNATLPVVSPHTNCIFASWMHMQLFPNYQNAVQYQTVGVAPNRRFIVYYEEPLVVESWDDCWSMAVVLHETTNQIEVFIRYKSDEPNSVQGIQNSAGTIGHITPGRNFGSSWYASDDGKRWTPNGVNSYLIEDIPFQMILNNSYSVYWNINYEYIPFSDTLIVVGDVGSDLNIGVVVADDNYCGGANLHPIPQTDYSHIDMPASTPNYQVLNDFCNSNSGEIYGFPTGYPDSLFHWSTLNVYGDTVIGLPPSDYPVVFTNVNGCEVFDTVTVINESTFSVDILSASCMNSDDGYASILPVNPYFSYEWINAFDTYEGTAADLLPGEYSCIVESSIGCSDTINFTVNAIDTFQAVIVQLEDESCFGSSNGSVEFDYYNGVEPYLFTWNGVVTTELILDSLSPGNYVAVVEDSTSNCVFNFPITIGAATELTIDVTTTPVIIVDDGSATVNVNGGAPPYVYVLDGATQSNGQFNDLSYGSHTCYITDQNGCQDSIVFHVSALSVGEMSNNQIGISPLPASDIIHLNGLKQSELIEFNFINIHGEYLQRDLFEIVDWQDDILTFDISKVKSGLYYLRIFDGINYLTAKLVVN